MKKKYTKKRIAIFTDNFNVGGIQKSLVNLLNNNDYEKYDIDVYVANYENNFFDVNPNANIIRFNKTSSILKFIPFNFAYKIYNPIVLNKEYDLAIDFDSYQMHTAIGALKCKSKKKAIWIHNDIQIKIKEEFKYRILHFFFKDKYDYFDTYCAVSQGALDSFKEINKNKNKDKCYLVIPNYIDTKEIADKLKEKSDIKVDKEKVNIVTVGRLCHQKGIDIMLDNIKQLSNVRKDFHLYIIGDGDEKEKLIEQMKRLDLEQYVTFLGNQKNPFKYLKEMDLFYLSSRYEGQGMVILEAKSVGLDVLIPKHLEKYCPPIKGVDDVLLYLKKYKRSNKTKKFDDLNDYNNNIRKELNNLFDASNDK